MIYHMTKFTSLQKVSKEKNTAGPVLSSDHKIEQQLKRMSELNTSLSIALPLVTIFWSIVAAVGFILPCFLRNNKSRGVIGVMIVLTAICCYVFWLVPFLAQLNPLFGPELHVSVAGHIRRAWGGADKTEDYSRPCFPSW